MTTPQLSKAWTISANIRNPYTSLVDMAGWFAYQNKLKLLASSWTLVWSSDGSTGPASDVDNTDRINSAADFATRGTVDAAPQSWFLVQNVDGVQLLFDYQGAGASPTGDDIILVSFSPGGLFARAATPTHKPTATDEVNITAATSIVNNGTSLDRVMSIFCADNGTGWRVVVFRNNALIVSMSLDKVARVAPDTTFPVPYVGSKFFDLSRSVPVASAGLTPIHACGALIAVGASTWRGWVGSVFTVAVTRVCRMFGASARGHTVQTYGNTFQSLDQSTMVANYCASLGGVGALCWPIVLWGEETANLDGPWCTMVDWTQMVTTSVTYPSLGMFVPGLDPADDPVLDPPRTNWFVAIGAGAIWPWKNAAPSMETI